MKPLIDTIILGYIRPDGLGRRSALADRTWLVLLLVALGGVEVESQHLTGRPRIARRVNERKSLVTFVTKIFW
jgi:hypothetical protein